MQGPLQIALTMILLTAMPAAAAPERTPEGAARTASALMVIAQFCGDFYRIRRSTAVELSSNARERTLGMLPGKDGQRLLDVELKQRREEVVSEGPSIWCRRQREIQRLLGTAVFPD